MFTTERKLCFVVVFLSAILGAKAYNGKLISSSWGNNSSHRLFGNVYAVDEDTFQVVNFDFENQAGTGAFHIGTDKLYSEARALDGADPTAHILSNPTGTSEALPSYAGEKVVISLKGVAKLSDATYIAIFNKDSNEYLGGMDLPDNFQVPAPVNIGEFVERAHDVRSGEVIVLNDRTIKIHNLTYDGEGPDAFFYVGVTEAVGPQQPPYGKIPGENGDTAVLGKFSGKDVTLTLPDKISAQNLKWLSIWCVAFGANFGEVTFPSKLNVPPYTQHETEDAEGPRDSKSLSVNCEPLSDRLHVSWEVSGDLIDFKLAGRIDQKTDYMAFGLSGSGSTFSMLNADVVVADWTDSEPRVLDYKITGYAQCTTNGGACPDTMDDGVNDLTKPSAKVVDGITILQYTRALKTGDSNDKEYKVDGTLQQVVWAIGPINSKKQAAKHYSVSDGGRINAATSIDFGREAKDNCLPFQQQKVEEKPKFQAHHIYGDEVDAFTFEIGPSASEQGYTAITGKTSWGIAWYVNGILIPELHLKRGVEYTFRVAGGDDVTSAAKYHPLCITTDEAGGLQDKKDPSEIVFPGTVNGKSANFATGSYCEWNTETSDKGKIYQCFQKFKDDLKLECSSKPAQYTEFRWTPTADMANELFYQCYTHQNLGWKIHLYNEYPADRKSNHSPCDDRLSI